MSIIFKSPTRHGTNMFVPSTPLAFADEKAEAYFVKAGFAEESDSEPVMTYPEGTVVIDPQTTFADGPSKGNLVMGDSNDG